MWKNQSISNLRSSSFGGKDGKDASTTANIEDNLMESLQVILPRLMFTFPRNRCLFLMMALRYALVLTSSWCAVNYIMNVIHLQRKIHETNLNQYRTPSDIHFN